MRTINSVMGLVGTLILTVIMGQSAHADIIKDNLNQFTGEIPYHRIFASYEPSGKTSLGVTIPGNGQKVSQISFVMSLDYGDYTPNHPAEEGDFTIRAGFHPDVTSYIDDPFCWDPQNPNYFQEFGTSDIVNPGWQDVIGTSTNLDEPGINHNLYLITIDVRDYNWLTTAGAQHVISLSIDGQEIMPGVIPYFAPRMSGSGLEDWWASDVGPFGPPELLSQHPVFTWGTNAAVRVETLAVPEPHTFCTAAMVALCVKSRRRCKCKPKALSTARIPPP